MGRVLSVIASLLVGGLLVAGCSGDVGRGDTAILYLVERGAAPPVMDALRIRLLHSDTRLPIEPEAQTSQRIPLGQDDFPVSGLILPGTRHLPGFLIEALGQIDDENVARALEPADFIADRIVEIRLVLEPIGNDADADAEAGDREGEGSDAASEDAEADEVRPEREDLDEQETTDQPETEDCLQTTCIDYATCQTYTNCGLCPARPEERCNGTDDDCDPGTPEDGEPTDCPSGEVCYSGECCANECPSGGQSVCETGITYKRCGEYDGDPCYEWGPAQSCTYGCVNGACVNCTPDCGNSECGDDGCGGSCGFCTNPPDDYCVNNGLLRQHAPQGSCTDGTCGYGFIDITCPWGCAVGTCIGCQAKTCESQGYECGIQGDGCGGSIDCGPCGDHARCNLAHCVCVYEECAGECCGPEQVCDAGGACCTRSRCGGAGRECGEVGDGCGGTLSCGDCDDNERCQAGDCVCEYESCNGECCGETEVCWLGACCEPSCTGRCNGEPDGCGGNCETCPDGYACQSGECVPCGQDQQPCCRGNECDDGFVCGGGNICVTCGGDGELCCEGDVCSEAGYICEPGSSRCKLMAFVKLFGIDPGGNGCGVPGYEKTGQWTTQPGQIDDQVEGLDGISGISIDAGWVMLCSLGGRIRAVASWDDCAAGNWSCPAGYDLAGNWHVGFTFTDCDPGKLNAVDAGGRQLQAGWLDLCVDSSLQAKLEIGATWCGEDGPGCGGHLDAAAWHVGSGCDGHPTINGYSGQTTDAGWAHLCILGAD